MKHKLIAYCLTRNLHLMTAEDVKALDSIHIAFGLIDNGNVYWPKETLIGDSQTIFAQIREWNPNVKIILSIGGWAADGFSQAAYSEEGRIQFAKTAIQVMVDEKMDGLDIDWEYPCIADGGIAACEKDKENFTLLLKELREQLNEFDEYKSLSIAAGGLPSYLKATNMGEVQQYLDYVQLMTYDFHGGFSEMTGHLANLYPYSSEVDAPSSHTTIELFVKAGVPLNKIVMGAAFYGREWHAVPSTNNGLSQKSAMSGDDFRGYAELKKIVAEKGEGFERFWDDEAKAAYLYNGDGFISFEDEEALKCKADYVKERGMYGLMYWEYEQDSEHELTLYLKKCLEE